MRYLLALIVLGVPKSAAAGDNGSHGEHAAHPPAVSIVNGVTYAFGGDGISSAVSVHGLRGAFAFSSRFKVSVEGGGAVILSDLSPAGYAQAGPGVIVNDSFQVSLYGTWKVHGHEETDGYLIVFGDGVYTEAHTELEHLIGAAVAPTFVTSFGNVNVPVGFQCPLGGHEGCAGVVGVKLVTDIFKK